jgi:hypothetical protein
MPKTFHYSFFVNTLMDLEPGDQTSFHGVSIERVRDETFFLGADADEPSTYGRTHTRERRVYKIGSDEEPLLLLKAVDSIVRQANLQSVVDVA